MEYCHMTILSHIKMGFFTVLSDTAGFSLKLDNFDKNQ